MWVWRTRLFFAKNWRPYYSAIYDSWYIFIYNGNNISFQNQFFGFIKVLKLWGFINSLTFSNRLKTVVTYGTVRFDHTHSKDVCPPKAIGHQVCHCLWIKIVIFKWLQRDSNPQPLSLSTNTQPFNQAGLSYVVSTYLYGVFDSIF